MNIKTTSKSQNQKELRQRVIALLTRREIEFLDKLGMDALFSRGSKLTRTKLISHIIDILIRLGIDGKGVKSSYDLEEKIKNVIIKNLVTQPLLTHEKPIKKEEPKLKEELKKIDRLEREINSPEVKQTNIEKKDGK
jgi:hypothetical protein